MQSHKYALVLLEKASQDIYVIEALVGDCQAADEIIGFRAQQAVEKILKAVSCSLSIHYSRTHDLVELLDLPEKNGVESPEFLEQTRCLNPFAVEFRRHDFLTPSHLAFDREWTSSLVKQVFEWGQSCVLPPSSGKATP